MPTSLKSFLAAVVLLSALLPGLAWPAKPQAPAQEGLDYAVIPGGKPWKPLAGQIEVVEVFSYTCGHCAQFQPRLDAWKRKQPKDVRVTYLPIGSAGSFDRGFFAALDARAVDRIHAPVFVAVHQTRTLPGNPSIDELAAFYATLGLDAKKMKAAMEAPSMAQRIDAAQEFAIASGVEGTPTLIVNGRYRILGNTMDAILANTQAVIAMVRAAR